MPFEATIAMFVKDSLVAVHVKNADDPIQTLRRLWTDYGKVRELFTADDQSVPRCINQLKGNKRLTLFISEKVVVPTIYRNIEDFVSETSDRFQLLKGKRKRQLTFFLCPVGFLTVPSLFLWIS